VKYRVSHKLLRKKKRDKKKKKKKMKGGQGKSSFIKQKYE
jgi:hypothetical protein